MPPLLKNNYRQITLAFVFLKLVLHWATNTNYELHRDEMLYFNQGDHLSLGYASVPPFIGWVAFLIKWVFGHSVFGIRLLPALLGATTIVIVAKIIETLGGKALALVLACSCFLLSPGFLLFDTLFTVNVFDQFFWCLIAFLFIKMIKEDNPKIWIPLGITSGLAFLNKYLVLYLMAGFLMGILLGGNRKIIVHKHFLVGVLAGILVISPNIYWQYAHGWPVFYHISELGKSQMVHMTLRHFLIDLFDLNYISTFFWLTGLLVVLVVEQEKQYRYISITALFILGLCIGFKGKAYYFLGFIPVLFALGGYVFEKYGTKKLEMINYLALVIIVFSSLLTLPFALPLLPFDKLNEYARHTGQWVSHPFSRWEDGSIHPVSQVFSDMTGWTELVRLVNNAYLQIPENERHNCTIYAERNYGYAGAVHFYGKKYNLPEAITFLDSYAQWAPDTIAPAPLIYIHREIAGLDRLFDTCSAVGAVDNPYFRESGVTVFLCRKPNHHLQNVYKQKALEEKKKYRRAGQ
ncbi:MAG: glycosyltransferase family 39 protein [Saprospiraceae bacterium]|nr:glycosyltransferase family 39 protein [Saprospiraceae bacterium]